MTEFSILSLKLVLVFFLVANIGYCVSEISSDASPPQNNEENATPSEEPFLTVGVLKPDVAGDYSSVAKVIEPVLTFVNRIVMDLQYRDEDLAKVLTEANVKFNMKLEFFTHTNKDPQLHAYEVSDYLIKRKNCDALIGPLTSSETRFSYIVNEHFKKPLVTPTASDPELSYNVDFPYLWKVSPPDSYQGQAIGDILQSMNCNEFMVMASKNDYGQHFTTELEILSTKFSWRMAGNFFVYDTYSKFNTVTRVMADIKKSLKDIKRQGHRIIVLIVKPRTTVMILRVAQTLGMTGNDYVWILSDSAKGGLTYDVTHNRFNPNSALQDEVDPSSAGISDDQLDANIIAISPVAHERILEQNVMSLLVERTRRAFEKERRYFRKSKYQKSIVPLEADRKVVNDYIDDVIMARDQNGIIHKYVEAYFLLLNCSAKPTLPVQDCLKSHHFFNDIQAAERVTYKIDYMLSSAWVSFGQWNTHDGLTIENNLRQLRNFNQRVVSHDSATYEVGVVCDAPYIRCLSNGRFGGYAIEIIEHIRDAYNFDVNYHLYEAYGHYDRNTLQWDGMMRDMILSNQKSKLDIGLMPAISHDRMDMVDFGKRISSSPIAFTTTLERIYKVERDCAETSDCNIPGHMRARIPERAKKWSFLEPLSLDLWASIIGSCTIVAFFTSLFDKLSPFGHHGAYFQSKKPEALGKMRTNVLHRDRTQAKILEQELESAKRTFNLNNALFWSFSSLWWQSPDAVPRCTSSRLMACGWAAASVIFICCYTANFISFVADQSTPDLVMQQRFSKIYKNDPDVDGSFILDNIVNKQGLNITTIPNSRVSNLLQKSIEKNIKSIWENHKLDAPDANRNVTRGVVDAIAEKSIFVWEAHSMRSVVNNLRTDKYYCEDSLKAKVIKLQRAGNVNRAFAFRKNSPLVKSFNEKLNEMSETGILASLQSEYLDDTIKATDSCKLMRNSDAGGSASATIAEHTDEPVSFELKQLVGVFILLGIAILAAMMVLVLEWLNAAHIEHRKSKQELSEPIDHNSQLFAPGNRSLSTVSGTGYDRELSVKQSLHRHASAVWRWNVTETAKYLKLMYIRLTHKNPEAKELDSLDACNSIPTTDMAPVGSRRSSLKYLDDLQPRRPTTLNDYDKELIRRRRTKRSRSVDLSP